MGNIVTTKTIDLSTIEVDNLTKECYLSQLETKVFEYSDKNIVSEKIDTIINNTFAYKGQSPATEREYIFISNAVKEDVFLNFNQYTLKDIEPENLLPIYLGFYMVLINLSLLLSYLLLHNYPKTLYYLLIL